MSDEGKIFVGGLSFDTDRYGLEQAFENYGKVLKSEVILDKETGRSRGFGFVTFENPEDAKDALEGMNGKEVDGRVIRVDEAGKGRSSRGSSGGGPRGGGRFGGSRGRGRSFSRGGYSDRSYSDRGYGDRGYSDRSYGDGNFSGGDRSFGGGSGGYRSGGSSGGGGYGGQYRSDRGQGGYGERSRSYREGYDSYASHD